MLLSDCSFDQIKEALNNFSEFPHQSPYFPDPVESAILIVLHPVNDEWHVLLTKRSENLTSHPGQISFPGGRIEPGDENLMATALRETEEEVGIPAHSVEVIAELTPVMTLTGYRIHPYVALTEEIPTLSLQAEEVERAFHVPLKWLIASENIAIVERKIQQYRIKTFRLDWQEHTIWGATALMIAELGHRLRQS